MSNTIVTKWKADFWKAWEDKGGEGQGEEGHGLSAVLKAKGLHIGADNSASLKVFHKMDQIQNGNHDGQR